MVYGQVELDQESWRRFQRAVRRSVDRTLPKRLGQANKAIGAMVIAKLQPAPDPAAVGEGAGATVRPSASRREVILRTGGAHRAGLTPRKQWGKRPGPLAFRRRPKRPYIRETVENNRDEIADSWLHAISDALSSAFDKTEP